LNERAPYLNENRPYFFARVEYHSLPVVAVVAVVAVVTTVTPRDVSRHFPDIDTPRLVRVGARARVTPPTPPTTIEVDI